MLKYWSLSQFKSVFNETKLELAPLTIFAGANSAGKSTIIQNILLTAQTIQSPVQNRPVVLNGHMVRLGAFTDIVSNANEKNEIKVGFSLEFPQEEDQKSRSSFIRGIPRFYYHRYDFEEGFTVECNYSFSIKGNKKDKDILKLQPLLETCDVSVSTRIKGKIEENSVSIKRSKKSINSRIKNLKLSKENLVGAEINSLSYEVNSLSPATYGRSYADGLAKKKDAGATLRHFLPSRISVVFDTVETEARQAIELLTATGGWRDLYVNPNSLTINEKIKGIIIESIKKIKRKNERISRRVEDLIIHLEDNFDIEYLFRLYRTLSPSVQGEVAQLISEQKDKIKESIINGRLPEYEIQFLPLSDLINTGVDATHYFFSSFVKYLGPLRDEPKPVYPLAGATDPTDIGFRGEHTAAVLDVHRNTIIEYIPSKYFSSDENKSKITSDKLSLAVQDWLNYMGVGSEVKTVDRGKLGHELKISAIDSETLHDLTQVGVGVSQVLPILVLSLLAESGSTLIFEQPELHLHPRVQTRLADFFVSMTKLKKQCIVETHSEYLINRLRYRAAISEGKDVSDSVIMYFVEKNEGQSEYGKIMINEYGVIEDWPRGFFDENEANAAEILRAGIKKHKKV